MRRLRSGLALLLALALATPVLPEPNAAPRAGLIRNQSGLPATFPLQVKTAPGRDYALTLIDADTGDTALTAYTAGGAFFKVLVPPGTYRLRFTHGDSWQGADSLFGDGPDTGTFELQDPLLFRIIEPGIKAGHLVDLTDLADEATTKPQYICQALRTELFPVPTARDPSNLDRLEPRERLGPRLPSDPDLDDRGLRKLYRYPMFRYDVRSRYCR
jgi:hypothetical protein